MAQFKVCVTDARHTSYEIERAAIEKIGGELVLCDCATEGDIIAQCADADALLLDQAPMTAKAIAALKRCKCINRYGVGYDNVDVPAATAAGIQVTYVPDYCAEDVSDHALALLFACLRQVPLRDRKIRQGAWNIHETGFRLKGKTLGLMGFGRIAQALARKCSGFGFEKILAYDPYIPDSVCEKAGVQRASKEDVLAQSDFISLHMPVTPETRHMIDAQALQLVKPTAILINTARGALVDSAALADAIREERLLYAGLDTHEKEPVGPDCPYRDLEHVFMTDHTGYSTVEGVIELKTKSAQNVVDVLTGKAPVYPVNHLN